jgi:hypothetical protein
MVQVNANEEDEVVLFREFQSRVHRVRFEGTHSESEALTTIFDLNQKLSSGMVSDLERFSKLIKASEVDFELGDTAKALIGECRNDPKLVSACGNLIVHGDSP